MYLQEMIDEYRITKPAGINYQQALEEVADWYADDAVKKYEEDADASHIPQLVKDNNLKGELEYAEKVRGGLVDTFTTAQRLIFVLSGGFLNLTNS